MLQYTYIYIYSIIYIYIVYKVLVRSKASVYLNLRGSFDSPDPRAILLPFGVVLLLHLLLNWFALAIGIAVTCALLGSWAGPSITCSEVPASYKSPGFDFIAVHGFLPGVATGSLSSPPAELCPGPGFCQRPGHPLRRRHLPEGHRGVSGLGRDSSGTCTRQASPCWERPNYNRSSVFYAITIHEIVVSFVLL